MSKTYLHYALILALFAAISGFLLSGFNLLTKGRIADYAKNREINACGEILPQATSFVLTQNQDFEYRVGVNEQGVSVGYIIKVAKDGYSSSIVTLVAVDNNFDITGMKIISQQETPGLGTKITEIVGEDKFPWFQQQFVGKKQKQVSLKKDGGTIAAVTGATISSRAVVDSVYAGISNLKAIVETASTKK